jgi:hypothetical protein
MPDPSLTPEVTPGSDSPDAHHYSSGDALTGEEALDITRAAPVRVIVLAGPNDSGKTTLLASLYERFLYGPLSGFRFAGSRTLVGFEHRCHLSRRASGRETPDTKRTSHTATDLLLHLSVRPLAGGPRQELLFTDVFGETFRQAGDSTEECEQLTVIRRANHLALLIDGEKLISTTHRQQPYSRADDLLASCLAVGLLGSWSHVQIVVTKWDLLATGPRSEEQMSFARAKSEWLQGRYAGKLGTVECFESAARPEASSDLDQPLGLDKLFDCWLSSVHRADSRKIDDRSPVGRGRAFDGFSRAWPVGPVGSG